MPQEIVFCKGGGCTAKLGPDLLSHVLAKLPRGEKDSNLLIGYDSCDDAAVYKISDDTAVVHTLDFFPPMVDDPYTFGQIAAANALSDIYAMGGTVKTALNIVCFPEKMDLNILGKIMQGGADKVIEAGGTLAGGHSIADSDVKYGLSVMGTVHPEHIYSNNTGQPSDCLLYTSGSSVTMDLVPDSCEFTDDLEKDFVIVQALKAAIKAKPGCHNFNDNAVTYTKTTETKTVETKATEMKAAEVNAARNMSRIGG